MTIHHFAITSARDHRIWHADDRQHALEQHVDAELELPIIHIEDLRPCPSSGQPKRCAGNV